MHFPSITIGTLALFLIAGHAHAQSPMQGYVCHYYNSSNGCMQYSYMNDTRYSYNYRTDDRNDHYNPLWDKRYYNNQTQRTYRNTNLYNQYVQSLAAPYTVSNRSYWTDSNRDGKYDTARVNSRTYWTPSENTYKSRNYYDRDGRYNYSYNSPRYERIYETDNRQYNSSNRNEAFVNLQIRCSGTSCRYLRASN